MVKKRGKLFSEHSIVELYGFDGDGGSIVADVNVYDDTQTVAKEIEDLYGYVVNQDKIKKTYLKYQLYGDDTEYAGYYDSREGVRGAFRVWSFDLDELEVVE
jgi:hypothetical protein